ncbi:Bifunctional transcriptional activator/DNA repair enzyme Ada [Planctopirus ephydatiae]|uniref:methylated-DNA--[protein]-cysteine S-methyltransferase n=2 Tax=Planctopirus ephydatiae TaxID=2528019 RepID=A0A518GMG6_9PLAN|nr:Bifunctional transcriptional activator/DNA repair enzyme Ada [Planctopirus ephydatiae]
MVVKTPARKLRTKVSQLSSAIFPSGSQDAAGSAGIISGEMIPYTITPTEFGLLMVAGSSRGLLYVAMSGDAESLAEDFSRRFGKKGLQLGVRLTDSSASKLFHWTQQILDYLAGKLQDWSLSLDVQGTPFQQEVWEALRQIPYGETRTYAQLATSIGKPAAVRAVANACGANPLVIVIPCHRVIGSDGQLTGFRWGIERKAALLKLERLLVD